MFFRRIFEVLGFARSRSYASDEKRGVLLSKSKYLAGLQCTKALWIHYNNKALLPEVDADTEALFDQGRQVGLLAQKLFPDGIDLGYLSGFDEPVEATRAALSAKKPLFEAAFVYDRCFTRADILQPVGDGDWDIIEVKSATEVKQINLSDLAFQRYVYEGNDLRIRRCFILHVNNSYLRNGRVDPAGLFSKIDVTKAVTELMPAVGPKVSEMLQVIDSGVCPEIKISPHCNSPYECSLKHVCWKFLPHPNVFDLRRGGERLWELLDRTIFKLEEIPTDFTLNEVHSRQIASHRSGTPHVDAAAIRTFLQRLNYPLYFLDFETIGPAIPLYDRSRPYVQIPFQFSLHKVEFDGALPTHFEFLADGTADPRPDVLLHLRKLLGHSGSIIGYNVNFEIARLKECAEVFPEYQNWVDSLLPRFVDLYDVFEDFSYYHPSQNGSASLKAVLPALTGVGYDGLEIGSGDFAQREFTRITFGDVTPAERSKVRTALKAYCCQDTRDLIEIVEELKKLMDVPASAPHG